MTNTLDITAPENACYVAKDGYVYYRTEFGTVGYNINTPVNEGCGWWSSNGKKEHFKVSDTHVRVAFSDGSKIITAEEARK